MIQFIRVMREAGFGEGVDAGWRIGDVREGVGDVRDVRKVVRRVLRHNSFRVVGATRRIVGRIMRGIMGWLMGMILFVYKPASLRHYVPF